MERRIVYDCFKLLKDIWDDEHHTKGIEFSILSIGACHRSSPDSLRSLRALFRRITG